MDIDNRNLYNTRYFRASKKFQTNRGRTLKFVSMIKLHNPKRVLDVGCGIGSLVRALRAEGIDALGLDFSVNLRKYSWGEDQFFIEADARNIPYKDQEFDLVFSSDFFEHIYEDDIDKVYSEMKRVGGKVMSQIAYDTGGRLLADQWKHHVTHKPYEWWMQKLPGILTTDPELLEIGSGKMPHRGFVTLDIRPPADIVGDFRILDFMNIGTIRSHHLLEHFGRDEALNVLSKWQSWLRKGGKLIVETPDFEGICNGFASMNYDQKYWFTRHAYGSQEASWAYHKDGWYEEKFRHEYKILGLKVTDVSRRITRGYLPNIIVEAIRI